MKDISLIRADFPILSTSVYGKPLVYFDNAATTQKPLCVLETIQDVYTEYNANIHRGVHAISDRASEEYEKAREKVRSFLNAAHKEEIIFTSGTTGSINAVAFSFGERYISEGDEVVVSHLEHHSNIVPWQMLCERKKARLKVIPMNESGMLVLEEYYKLLSPRTKIVAVTQVSNALGTIQPVSEIISAAHSIGVPVLVDGAQGIQHGITDVQKLDCDFYVFSGHKIYGPAGTGVLYGKNKWLSELPPYQGGGDMVANVTFDKTTYNELPFRFEAGTTNFPGAIGLASALGYVDALGRENIAAREKELLGHAINILTGIPQLRIIGNNGSGISTISFLINGIHPYDTGMILDKLGVAVRTGAHCAQPVMDFYEIEGTVRASLCFYNTIEEINLLGTGIEQVIKMFS
ncbi:MAG: SufS family cysteine desulfurase [Bacteroidales bacterium]|nr:SufS family cysteine desulfurase [Bacteroidales bacterium]